MSYSERGKGDAQARVTTNADEAVPDVELGDKPDLLADMTPQARFASERDYNRQCAVTRGTYSDFDDVVASAPKLRQAAAEAIKQGGLPNAGHVTYYLASNPDQIHEINRMTLTDAQHRIFQLSKQLETKTVPLDEAPFSEYRRRRNEEIKNRYR